MSDVPTLGTWLAGCAQRPGDVSRIVVEGRSTDASMLDATAASGAAGLGALGLRPGDRVAVLMRASVAALQVWFSVARAGLVEVPLNPDGGSRVLEYALRSSRARALVCDADLLDGVAPILERLDRLEHVVVAGAGHTPSGAATDLDELLREPVGAPPEVDPRSPAVILYTSGTTGPPKGVLLSHQANINLAKHTVQLMRYTPRDRLYSVFPLVPLQRPLLLGDGGPGVGRRPRDAPPVLRRAVSGRCAGSTTSRRSTTRAP